MNILVIAEKGSHDIYHFFDSLVDNSFKCTPDKYRGFLSEQNCDLVILDCGFEPADGLELLKEIKIHYPSVPTIFITDTGSEDIILKAFKTGARDFFRKPVNIIQLQETVMGILSVKKASRESRRPFTHRPFRHGEVLKKVTTSQPVCLTRAIRYIDDHLHKEITLDEISQKANVSKYHFCRLFRKHFGITPMQFVISKKITRARELLRRKDANISMVAAEVGFNDLSSFAEQFRKFTGKTPTKYKKSIKRTIKRK